MKYNPEVCWRPAFDDGELFLHDKRFADPKEAKKFAAVLNNRERIRLKNKEPDTLWFVIKCTTRFAEAWNPKARVVKKKPRNA